VPSLSIKNQKKKKLLIIGNCYYCPNYIAATGPIPRTEHELNQPIEYALLLKLSQGASVNFTLSLIKHVKFVISARIKRSDQFMPTSLNKKTTLS
jgi:hypothetical protein